MLEATLSGRKEPILTGNFASSSSSSMLLHSLGLVRAGQNFDFVASEGIMLQQQFWNGNNISAMATAIE